MNTVLMNGNSTQAGRRRAFTLIELLIVIAILLAIGGLVVVNLIPRGEQAKMDLQRVQFDQIDNAMKQFRLDMNRWPSEEEGIEALWRRDSLEDEEQSERWRGPYLETPVTEDNWGNELIYRNPARRWARATTTCSRSAPTVKKAPTTTSPTTIACATRKVRSPRTWTSASRRAAARLRRL